MTSYFFVNSGVRFEIWTLLFFRTPLTSATSEVRQKNIKFIVAFDVEKREGFGVI